MSRNLSAFRASRLERQSASFFPLCCVRDYAYAVGVRLFPLSCVYAYAAAVRRSSFRPARSVRLFLRQLALLLCGFCPFPEVCYAAAAYSSPPRPGECCDRWQEMHQQLGTREGISEGGRKLATPSCLEEGRRSSWRRRERREKLATRVILSSHTVKEGSLFLS